MKHNINIGHVAKVWQCFQGVEMSQLHTVCQEGNLARALELIEENPGSVSLQNESGDTPLHVACKTGKLDLVKVLIEAGNIDVISVTDKNRRSPVSYACSQGHADIVEFLTEKNCAVLEIFDAGANSCARQALIQNHVEIYKYITLKSSTYANYR